MNAYGVLNSNTARIKSADYLQIQRIRLQNKGKEKKKLNNLKYKEIGVNQPEPDLKLTDLTSVFHNVMTLDHNVLWTNYTKIILLFYISFLYIKEKGKCLFT